MVSETVVCKKPDKNPSRGSEEQGVFCEQNRFSATALCSHYPISLQEQSSYWSTHLYHPLLFYFVILQPSAEKQFLKEKKLKFLEEIL